MDIKKLLIIALMAQLTLNSHAQDQLGLIPKPNQVKLHKGKPLTLGNTIQVKCPAEFAASLKAGMTGFQLKTATAQPQLTVEKSNNITHREGYSLDVTAKGILIRAKSYSGVFYATQTLKQLMPASVFTSGAKPDSISIPLVSIKDKPRFGWRGIMLDSSRHFQPIDEIRRYIDRLAAHKFNVFHWHLTDGHGWRFESKKYPNLHKRGSWRMQPGYPIKGQTNKYGGYYTQKEMKEMVAYAKTRGITIVPEIDMPGHCFAWVAAYPMMGCLEKEQGTDFLFTYPADAQRFPGKPGTDVLCVGKDEVVKMCKDILDETMEIFPSKFIHIGGDEVQKQWWKKCDDCQKRKKDKGLKDEHELQSWFIQQLDNHITSKGRRLIGWDEILEGGLAKNATVMSWQGEKGGIKAAKMGHDVVMSPQTYIYLDHGQSHSPLEPPHWPGHKPLDRAYKYEPIPPQLSPSESRHILGVQGNVWTIFTHEEWLVDLCTWPRAAAIAETGWSRKSDKNWDNFYQRLSIKHRPRLDAMNINYWWEISTELGKWSPRALKPNNKEITLSYDVSGKIPQGKLPINLNYTGGAHGLTILAVALYQDNQQIAIDQHQGFTGSRHEKNTYTLNVPALKRNAKLTLKVKAYGDGGTNSNGTISINKIETKILKKLPYEDGYVLEK